MIFYVYGYGDVKNAVISILIWILPYFLEKSRFGFLFLQNLLFVNHFWKLVKMPQETQQKKLLNLLRVQRGEINFRAPAEEFATMD